MDIIGWHGGWGSFEVVDPRRLGSGEGDSLGWAFYFAANRQGGEYFAEWAHRTPHFGAGYLHKVHLSVARRSVWIEPAEGNMFMSTRGDRISWSDYLGTRGELGDARAAQWLLGLGVDAIVATEEMPAHGVTYAVLNLDRVRIIESYRYCYDLNRCSWDKAR